MHTQLSKAALARLLGVSRQSLYYQPKKPTADQLLKQRIVAVMRKHPAYGHRRIAIALSENPKRIYRVMRNFGLSPRIQAKNRYRGKTKESAVLEEIPNRIRSVCAIQPNAIWSGDFTRMWFSGRELHLATVIDLFTREIVAWQLGFHHTGALILDVLREGKRRRRATPQIFHTDQGSEYTSSQCVQWLVRNDVLPSWSAKGKPWHNGIQEAFFRYFKMEFESPNQYTGLPALQEAIGKQMHYYNTERIHSSLKMPPRSFYKEKKWKA